MIILDSFSFTYPGVSMPALCDINMRIEDGTAVLLCGDSGSGKSTLLYCLNGLIPQVFEGVSCGSIHLNGVSPSDLPLQEMAKFVGTVFQNPESQLFMMRVEDDVAFGCENLCLPREEIIQRRDDALHAMGLWDLRHSEISHLSGGEKQRLAISSVYAMGPQIFLFDEPTTDLDGPGRGEFVQILRDLKAQGKTVILVEHQYEDYLPFMDRIVVMEEGRIISDSGPINRSIVSGRTWPVYSGKNEGSKTAPVKSSRPVVELRDVSFSYHRGNNVLKKVDVTIHSGEIVALRGDNGSGKTTLLKLMGGLLRPLRGVIAILGLSAPRLEDLIGRVGFLFQNPDEQLFASTVEEEVAFGPVRLGRKAEGDRYLEMAGLLGFRRRHPQTLSRGQRQILAVASVMAMEPEILILDEPTTGLDVKSWQRLFLLFREYTARGGTVIFSTHNVQAAAEAGSRIILQEGRITAHEISG